MSRTKTFGTCQSVLDWTYLWIRKLSGDFWNGPKLVNATNVALSGHGTIARRPLSIVGSDRWRGTGLLLCYDPLVDTSMCDCVPSTWAPIVLARYTYHNTTHNRWTHNQINVEHRNGNGVEMPKRERDDGDLEQSEKED